MARSNGSAPGLNLLIPLATIILVIATLHYARDVIVPICLAILLSFVLSPVVGWFEKLHLKRVPAAILVTVLFVAGAAALTWVVAGQLVNVAVQLPEYRANIEKKLERAPGEPPNKLISAIKSFQDLENSNPLEAATDNTEKTKPSLQTRKNPSPAAVVVESKPFSLLSTLLGPILGPLVTIGAVIVFSVFMLADREFLRNKMLRLAGRGHLTTTTRALDEASHRVSRYLLLQSIVNICYGTIVAVGLHFLGIPNPIVWGVLTGLLRYVPYVGAFIATALPTILAFGAFADWHRALYVLIFYLGLEFTTADFVEPYIYGSQTGISALAILVAAIFWTLIWGPVGLLLSTPLTVCLAAFGKHVPNLEFLSVLLGDAPVLSPHVKVYQRLMADDLDEALAIAKEYLTKNSIGALYDSVLIPVLTMAGHDRRRGALIDSQESLVMDNLKELLEELNLPDGGNNEQSSYSQHFANHERHASMIVVPVRNEADEIASILLCRLAGGCRPEIDILPPAPLKESVDRISKARPSIVCLSAVPPFSLRYARAFYKTLKDLDPDLKVLVGIWAFEGPTISLQERIGMTDPDKIATTLAEGVQQIEGLASELSQVSE